MMSRALGVLNRLADALLRGCLAAILSVFGLLLAPAIASALVPALSWREILATFRASVTRGLRAQALIAVLAALGVLDLAYVAAIPSGAVAWVTLLAGAVLLGTALALAGWVSVELAAQDSLPDRGVIRAACARAGRAPWATAGFVLCGLVVVAATAVTLVAFALGCAGLVAIVRRLTAAERIPAARMSESDERRLDRGDDFGRLVPDGGGERHERGERW
jgi:hypothetical protein